jgi:ABC-type transport system involved in multi-copper enzyme maturation permease subunit
MFAILEIEQMPLNWVSFPAALYEWIEAAGGFAALGLGLWLIFRLIRSQPIFNSNTGISLRTWVVGSLLAGLVIAVLPALCFMLWDALGLGTAVPAKAAARSSWLRHLGRLITSPEGTRDFLFLPSALALGAVLVPFLFDAAKVRGRRVLALAKLSFKEAIRRRVLWAFSFLLLLFLFASWFLPYKPEDQVRNYVGTVNFATMVLLLFTAGLLACFSLPTDLRNQTIHTIVTKPVERFEIIAGRFLGFTFLMTLVLAVMSLLSLVYVTRNIDREAQEESFKARIPVYGDLRVLSLKEGQLVEGGKSVGREWDYRKYISGGVHDEKATWTFYDLPRDLETKSPVRCEFGFDIFRTAKGKYENRGVECSFTFMNWKCRPELEKELSQQVRQKQGLSDPEQVNREFARDKGFFEVRGVEVVDYHTLAVNVPAELFEGLSELNKQKGEKLPALAVVVRLEDLNQLLGVAKYDLYLLEDEGKNSFWLNFLKGSVGLWFQLCLVIGIGVTCSTCLSGIIAFLLTAALYLGGWAVDFIRDVASGQTTGGGPMEAIMRIQEGKNLIAPLDETPMVKVMQFLDLVFEWVLRRFLNLLPDVSRFDLTNYVAQGFDISIFGRDNSLVLDGLLLTAYLLPWLVLGHYLMKSREVAA